MFKRLNQIKHWLRYRQVVELLYKSDFKSDCCELEFGKTDFCGFYMLEIFGEDLPVNLTCATLVLHYADCKEDLNILLKKNSISKRIIYIKSLPKKIHIVIDVLENHNLYYENIRFELVKISKNFAFDRIKKKLTKSGIYKDVVFQLPFQKLYRHYNDVFCVTKKANNYRDWIDCLEYQQWVREVEKKSILFSLVLPVYNTEPIFLRKCVDSIKTQIYTNWELIIVNDGSSRQDTVKLLSSIVSSDERIRLVSLIENQHISLATNNGLKEAKGEYIVFVDHDDMLSVNALNELASVICEDPGLKLIYSDEDLISETDERKYPHFKPDWNLELLLAHNYITHLVCIEKSILERLNFLRVGYEGAQDYDLLLRASEVLLEEQIFHIPKVLYHWRMATGSTAEDSSAKSYTMDAGLRALEDYIARNSISGEVVHAAQKNYYKVNWEVSASPPLVSIIIPTRNCLELLRTCIESIYETTENELYEIIVMDNGSDETDILEYFDFLCKDKKIKIIRDNAEFNFSRLNNLGVESSKGELILLLNNDVQAIHKGWLTEMISIAIRGSVGCVGAKLYYPDGTIQHAGVILGLGGFAAHSHRGIDGNSNGYFNRLNVRQNMSAVTAACLMVKKSIYEAIGGLDEKFAVAYNDVDFCLRVDQAGFKNVFTPYARLIHHESKSRGRDTSKKNAKRFDKEKDLLRMRWGKKLNDDPAYNPNLTKSREDFSII